MALSNVSYTGNGTNRNFNVTFPYISQTHVEVLVNGTSVPYTFLSSSVIQTTTAPANSSRVLIRRVTPAVPLVDFADASTLTEADLDLASLQSFYVAQEAKDALENNLALDFSDNTFNAQTKRIKSVASPTANSDAATKQYVDAAVTGINPVLGLPAASVTVANGTGLAATTVQDALAELESEKAVVGHTHAISGVTGLQAALDAKVDDTQISSFMLSVLDDADAATARATLNAASTSVANVGANGLLSASDKAKLDATTGAPDVIIFDQKASGTTGGTSTASTWATRTLNTTHRNTLGADCVLASNVITLAAGTYRIQWEAAAYQCNFARTRIRNTTDSVTLGVSNSEFSFGSGPCSVYPGGEVIVSLGASKNIELQMWTSAAITDGYGRATSSGEVEQYARIAITKVR